MHELDRIEQALASSPLDHRLFERCAQDLLVEVYPGLSPIPGGTDWGRDADIPAPGAELAMRLLATTSRTPKGVRANMMKGLRSLKEHNVPFTRLVLANPAHLTELQRQKLSQAAKEEGATVEAIYDRTFFASRLRRDGEWRSRLLGLSGEPITLSRLPSDLAESPWAQIPLVGRDRELQIISSTEQDLLVTGPPGVGKTRLLAETDDAYFVDSDAPIDRLADDIRWLQPETLVLDDAARSEALLRELVRFRQVEPDLAHYRLIAVCWPDEVDRVRTWIGTTDTVDLGLLERRDIDQVLVSMGLTGQLARSEILAQAEGRPGWAVALADTLLRAADPKSLVSGKALLGEVQRFLRRAAIPGEAVDLLATVSALGGLDETEFDHLGDYMGTGRTQVVRLLTAAATGGLVDVEALYVRSEDRTVRRFTVRPPMLADVLVAERAYAGAVPGIDLWGLRDRFPDRLLPVAEGAVDSAFLGVKAARPDAEKFFEEALAAPDVPAAARVRLAQRFARIDRDAAELILRTVRSNLNDWSEKPDGDRSPWEIEPLIELSYLIARWYLIDEAVRILLDAACLDKREMNPHPGHPLRKLGDLVHDFHPELPPPREQRELLARAADDWIEAEPSDERWIVFGHALEGVLSLHLRSALTAPGDPSTLHLVETVVEPAEIHRIYEDLWPPIRRRLESAPGHAIRSAIEAVEDWLRIGGGYDQPFGRSHPQPSIDAARELGARLFGELVPLVADHPGLVSYLQDVADRFQLHVGIALTPEHEAFFADIDREEDWAAATNRLEEGIKAIVMPWANEDRVTVLRRLVTLRSELELSSVRWPDRVWIACTALADRVDDPIQWTDAALQLGLFPQAEAFLGRAVERGKEIGARQVQAYLGNRAARGPVIHHLLTIGSSRIDRATVLRNLAPEDYGILRNLFLRGSLSPERAREVLTQPPASARGAAAAAMFAEGRGDRESWTPGELENEWLDAIQQLDPTSTFGFRDFEATELVRYLAQRYPDVATAWVSSRLEAGIESRNVYRALSHGAWEALHLLPHNSKDELWSRFTHPSIRWLLGREMVGDDIEWLAHAIDEGLMTAEEAVETYNGLGIHPPIEELARLLVPRGVDARRIAYFAQSGTWSGEESHRYSQMIEQFSSMARSNEETVASVGRAGVEIFTEARDEALQEERKKRIRGDL